MKKERKRTARYRLWLHTFHADERLRFRLQECPQLRRLPTATKNPEPPPEALFGAALPQPRSLSSSR